MREDSRGLQSKRGGGEPGSVVLDLSLEVIRAPVHEDTLKSLAAVRDAAYGNAGFLLRPLGIDREDRDPRTIFIVARAKARSLLGSIRMRLPIDLEELLDLNRLEPGHERELRALGQTCTEKSLAVTERLNVSPMNQQKGVGNTLLNKSIDYATKAGVQVLFGGASENTAALYREGGWQIRSLPLKPGMDTEIKPILIYKFIST